MRFDEVIVIWGEKYAQRFEKFDVLRNCHQKIAFLTKYKASTSGGKQCT